VRLEATIQSVRRNGDWYEVEVDGLNGAKLATKLDKLGRAAFALEGQRAQIEYEVRKKTTKDREYTNYYLSEVHPADIPEVPSAPERSQTDVERELRIMRQTAAKVAVQLLEYVEPGERNFKTMIVLADRLVGYFMRGAS